MPTGYTAAVADGTITELCDFAMQLARGMGACINMRDDPWGAPIPERFEPSDYHRRAMEVADAERARVLAMTDEECLQQTQQALVDYRARREEWREGRKATRQRYEAMLLKVEDWAGAPDGIKEFALEQLRTGMEFDCPEGEEYYAPPPPEDPMVWRQQQLDRLNRDAAYHAREYHEEVERVAGRNAWLAQLRASLEET